MQGIVRWAIGIENVHDLTNQTLAASMQRGCRSAFVLPLMRMVLYCSFVVFHLLKWGKILFPHEIRTIDYFFFDSFTSPTLPKSSKPGKIRRRELTEEENDEIREAFELFDNDKDNELDYHEFKVNWMNLLLRKYFSFD